MALAVLISFLCLFTSLAHALPPSPNIEPRQQYSSWTSLPVRQTAPACSTAGQTNCYAVDQTWTAIYTSASVTAKDDSPLPTGTATVIGIVARSGGGAPTTYWPPPVVTAHVGQRIRLTLVNTLPEKVTLHFHGILMDKGYGVMDGPEMVTQWYVFFVSLPF